MVKEINEKEVRELYKGSERLKSLGFDPNNPPDWVQEKPRQKRTVRLGTLRLGEFFTGVMGNPDQLYMVVSLGAPFNGPDSPVGDGDVVVLNMSSREKYITRISGDAKVMKENVEIRHLVNDHSIEHVEVV